MLCALYNRQALISVMPLTERRWFTSRACSEIYSFVLLTYTHAYIQTKVFTDESMRRNRKWHWTCLRCSFIIPIIYDLLLWVNELQLTPVHLLFLRVRTRNAKWSTSKGKKGKRTPVGFCTRATGCNRNGGEYPGQKPSLIETIGRFTLDQTLLGLACES